MKQRREYRLPPFVPDTIPPRLIPKNHEGGTLKVGDSVFYGNERYYVEYVPATWDKGAHVRISSRPVSPQPGVYPPNERLSFHVHADLLTLAPVRRDHNPYKPQPTKHAIENRQKAKATGRRDIGDEVATLLRGAKTLDDVFKIAAKFLGEKPKALQDKYKHLNPGQQRMVCGNRMRAYAKKGK